MAGPTVLVRFIADAKDLRKGVDDADAATSGFKANLLKVGAAVGVAFSAKAVIDFARDSIKAAQDLNANLSRTQTIFGDAAGGVIDFSRTTATSLGLAQADSLAAANAIGKTLVGSMGLSTGAAADMSVGVVKLAKDMATFNRVPFDQALEAIQKGLTGQTRGLKTLGVVMSDAEIKQKAVTMGIADGTKALDPAQKAQASYALLLERTTLQQGAAARASGSAAAQQAQMSAQWKDAQATLGNLLLPTLTLLVTILNTYLLPAVTAVVGWIKQNQDVVAALAIGVGVVAAVILAGLVPAFLAWAAAALGAAAATLVAIGPFVLVGAAVAAVAYLIISNWDTIKAVTAAVWNFILGAIQAVWNWLLANWPLVLGILTGPIGLAAALIYRYWDQIMVGVTAVKDWIVGAFNTVVGFVTGLPGRIAGAAAGMWDGIKNAFRAAINWIIDGWNGLRFGIPEIDTHIPGIGKIGGGDFGVPRIPRLARGGVITAPTLAVLGEGAGREIAAPEPLLREIVRTEGRSGPAVVIQNAVFAAETDIEMLMRRAEFELAARRL